MIKPRKERVEVGKLKNTPRENAHEKNKTRNCMKTFNFREFPNARNFFKPGGCYVIIITATLSVNYFDWSECTVNQSKVRKTKAATLGHLISKATQCNKTSATM